MELEELELNELENIITLEKECNCFSYTETTKTEGTTKKRTKTVKPEAKEKIKKWTKTEENAFNKYLLSFNNETKPVKGSKIVEYQDKFIKYLFGINDEENFSKLIDGVINVTSNILSMTYQPLLVTALSVKYDIIRAEFKNDLAIVDDSVAKMKLTYLDKLTDACPALTTSIANNNILMYLIPFYTRLLILTHSTDNINLVKKYFGRSGYDMVSFADILKNACDYMSMNYNDLVDDLLLLIDNIYQQDEMLKYLTYCNNILSLNNDRLNALSKKINLDDKTTKLIVELRNSSAKNIIYSGTLNSFEFSLLFNVGYELENNLKKFNPDLIYYNLCNNIEQMIFTTSNDFNDGVDYQTYTKLWLLYAYICNYLNVQYGYRKEMSEMMYSIYTKKYTEDEIVDLLIELNQSLNTEKDRQYIFNIITGYKNTSTPIHSTTLFGYDANTIILSLAADERLSMHKLGYELYEYSNK